MQTQLSTEMYILVLPLQQFTKIVLSSVVSNIGKADKFYNEIQATLIRKSDIKSQFQSESSIMFAPKKLNTLINPGIILSRTLYTRVLENGNKK